MKKYISQKVDEYLKLSPPPSMNKKESAQIITENLLKDPQFKKSIHLNTLADIKEDICDEVFEILQKKTYGFYSLKEYYEKKDR